MQLLFKLKQALGFCCAKGCWRRSKYTLSLKSIRVERHICEKHLQEFEEFMEGEEK